MNNNDSNKCRLEILLQLVGSSDPSTQSLSRSHTQTRGMQRLVMAHWNWVGAQVTSAVTETHRVCVCHYTEWNQTTWGDSAGLKSGCELTTVLLILSLSTVVLAIAAENTGNAATWVGTFELAGQANMDICREKQTEEMLEKNIDKKKWSNNNRVWKNLKDVRKKKILFK